MGVVNEVAGNVLHGLSDAPRRLVWEVRVGVGGVDVESVPKVERNSWYSVKAVRRPNWTPKRLSGQRAISMYCILFSPSSHAAVRCSTPEGVRCV